MSEKKLKIVQVASEVEPFAKTGGLADVLGALPQELVIKGHTVKLFVPFYKCIADADFKIIESSVIKVDTFEGLVDVGIKYLSYENIDIYFIDFPDYFMRTQLYGDKDGDYGDNLERFSLFTNSVLTYLMEEDFKPDIIHAHDWQAALFPVFIRNKLGFTDYFDSTKVIYTIHNLAYQGVFDIKKWYILQLPRRLYHPDYLEFWNNINLMKGGIVFSDAITTVSRKYSEEIQTSEYGCGMESVLKLRKEDIYGILNGIDYSEWNPETDKHTYGINFDVENLSDKELIKKRLLDEFGLEYIENVPLIGIITRLVDQKGIDLIVEIIDNVFDEDVYFILLGTGDEKYHKFFTAIQKKYPDKVGVKLTFDNSLAHKIEAGSDMFLMPSRFEPCGLNQLYSLRYGTLPIVRETGGLADTIKDNVNGFSFSEYSSIALLGTIKRALDLYKNKQKIWKKIQINAMEENFSWTKSTEEYEKLFLSVLSYK